MRLLVLLLVVFLSLPALAAIGTGCHADGAAYKPQGHQHLGDGDYELVLQDLHPKLPGGDYVRLHLNLYDPKTHKLLATAALTNACVANGLAECQVSMAGIRQPIDITALNQDLSITGNALLGKAPFAILLPHLTERFYYGVHVDVKNPDVKYFSRPPAMMALPPELWIRDKCGKPSMHFGHVG